MATNKRFAFNQTPPPTLSKLYGASVTVQLPSTSANYNQSVTSRSSDESRIRPQMFFDRNNNANSSNSTTNFNSPSSVVSSCQVNSNRISATRHLLLNASAPSTSSNATSSSIPTDSDESPTPPPNYHEIPGIVPSYQGRTSGPPPSYDDIVNPNAPPPSYQSLFGQAREARKTSNGFVDLFRQLFLILIGTLGCTMIIGFLLLIPITMILVGLVYMNDCRAENIPHFLVIGGFVWIIKNILNCYNQFKKDSSTANRPPPRRTPISPSSAANRSTTTSSSISTTSSSSSASSSSSIVIVNQNYANINMDANETRQQRFSSTGQTQTEVSQQSTTAAITTQSNTATNNLGQTTIRTTRVSNSRDNQNSQNRIRHPTMIGLTSFKCESILNYFLMVWFLAGCIVVYRIYEPDYENPLSASYCNRTVYLYAFWLMTSAFIIMAIVLSCLCCLMASSLMSCNHGR